MRSLVALYPRRWRERYGAEFEALLESQPFSLGLVIDVLFGAVDARVRPQAVIEMAAQSGAARQGESRMLSKALKLRCAGYGPHVTRRDQWMSVAVMIVGTVLLTLVWMALHVRFGDNPYVDSFSLVPFLTALLLSMPFTYFKGRPLVSQAVVITGSLLLIVLCSLLVGFLSARL